MATVSKYQTANGTKWRVRYRKPDGSQTDRRGFDTKRDADLFMATIEISKASGTFIDPLVGKKTVDILADQWKRTRLARLKRSTQNTMETSWRIHGQPKWGNRTIASIRSSEIEDWITDLSATLSAQTVRRAVFALSSILQIAVRDKFIHTNPAQGVLLPAKKRKPIRYLTHEQVELFATQAGLECDWYETYSNFLAYCGPRWGEATSLRVVSLNLLRKRARIETNVVRVKGEYVFGTPKSGKTRETPIPAFLITPLSLLCVGKQPDDLVFGAGDVPMPTSNADSGWFVKTVRRCQAIDNTFPSITPHDLRHTTASLAVSAGANVKAVQEMLGHASAAVTLDIYADLFPSDLDSVAVALSAARERAVG